jgi:AAA domain, putative AbiEii toxin, Type IV TA system
MVRACVLNPARVDWIQMLERLHLKNVGPAPELEMEFAPRVNLITGDNGLGKSFLLEVGFFAFTHQWTSNLIVPPVNKLDSRKKETQDSIIQFQIKIRPSIQGANDFVEATYRFDFRQQSWLSGYKRYPPKRTDSLVVESLVSGGYTIFDPIRNVFKIHVTDVFNGHIQDGQLLSNGLIRDWATWQLENGEAFQQFKAALATLSPHEGEKLEPGKLTRVSLDDARDIPTLKMPYGQEVPITQASAGIRRVVSLAYMLVWTWQEHLRAAELTRQEPAREIVLLIDELEQHLHPRWQRVILPALLETVKELMKSDVRVQIIATTHSPMVLASLEPLYDDAQDAWFDLNLVDGTVTLERMPWRKRGDASAWLTSEAFDLPSSGSLDREGAMDRAAKAMTNPKLTKKMFLDHDRALRGVLGETDPFWVRWRFMGEKKGWL